MRRLLLSTAIIVASASYVVGHDLGPASAGNQQLTAAVANPQQIAAASATPPPANDGGRTALTASLIVPTRGGEADENFAPPAQVAAAPVGGAPTNTPVPVPRPTLAPTTPTPTVQTPTLTANTITATPAATGQYADGTYTGPSVYAVYGQVQVQLVVSGGRVTAVNVLDYPNHTSRSRQISDYVLPRLRSQVIQNQSASVSFYSGATLTIRAFRTSLASALNAAHT